MCVGGGGGEGCKVQNKGFPRGGGGNFSLAVN